MKVLAVIPARGGSKGIPRKNVRLMAGKPLIYYSIDNAKKCNYITDVAVTSDDEEILFIAQSYGAIPLRRNPQLAEDTVTLDPVIFDAVLQMEKKENFSYDIVVTLQATSPVLQLSTLNQALEDFIGRDYDTYISAVNKPHLSWAQNEKKEFYPLYKKRLNRQDLPPSYSEAGAFLITRRECITENNRIGNRMSVYALSETEAIDIDTPEDWIICENILKRKKIVLRADGYKRIGMGHIYHCLTLAYNLIGHDIIFVTNEAHIQGIKKIREAHFPLKIIKDDFDFFNFLREYQPDIVVNDCLDTEARYMKEIKKLTKRLVTIEDLGDGSSCADVIINALYEQEDSKYKKNLYSGEKYICLRDEFIMAEPKSFSETVQNVLVLFGGTDPSNLTASIYKIAQRMHKRYPFIKFTFLAGIGYNCEENGIITREEDNIFVVHDAKFVSAYMKEADLAFTSQGRTVYEFAVFGVPAIVLAQNIREQMHTFAQMGNGFFNLGLGSQATEETILRTFDFLVNTPQLRSEMRNLMLLHAENLKAGVKREISLILGENFL